ncbi:MAG: elongation factor 4 [Candidatus Wallbacteria bacterium]|nr:elongation factor 4 [Candidatus Wallbacteria bacterium]
MLSTGPMTATDLIRNFAIIAHIDHGKSTLADRVLELTGTLTEREMGDRQQILDSIDLERERGITIKAKAVRTIFKSVNGETYQFNLIDTPGHVDFTYEVSRSLAACEGAILVVDAVQGVEAQTIANVYLALENSLEIVPAINKIDLPSAQPDEVKRQIQEVVGIDAHQCLLISAKDGRGVAELLEAVVERIPPPKADPALPLRALIIDSHYDSYQGVICYLRIVDGTVRKGSEVILMSTGKKYQVTSLGIFTPKMVEIDELSAGEVGFMAAAIKDIREARIGDTVTLPRNGATEPLPGYKEAQPVVYCGMFTVDNADFENLREALGKLRLNDASFTYEPDTSVALGFGFRCGFLGLLHMEIIQERLEREYDLELITTAPSVRYRVELLDGSFVEVTNPTKLPPAGKYTAIHEPYVQMKVYFPSEFTGVVMDLVREKRGEYLDMTYIGANRVAGTYELPFADIITDFYDKLKSRTRGYASMEYSFTGYKAAALVKLDIAVAGEIVDALSCIVPEEKAYSRGSLLTSKLKELIPRQLFEVPVQAMVGSRAIARVNIKANRKNVLAKCYGGDITRKRKLLEKQKAGKRRMKQVGAVEIPQEAFMAILSID